LNPEDSSFSLSDDSSSCDETERFKHTIVKSHTKAARVTRPMNLLLSEPVAIVEEDEVPLRVKDIIHEEQDEEVDDTSK
jgi:hypothetical protein